MINNVIVLMTAMPPTKGHEDLLRFASNLQAPLHVVINTEEGEPYVTERVESIRRIVDDLTHRNPVTHYDMTLPQSPEEFELDEYADLKETHGTFWNMWKKLLDHLKVTPDTVIVASEPYGINLAKALGCRFFPYDMERQIRFTKATLIRDNLIDNWGDISGYFKPFLTRKVTIFGAESCGKTTTAQKLATRFPQMYTYSPEWAREYLESLEDNTLNRDVMTDIVEGQFSLQESVSVMNNTPVLLQDTDLYSTIGYWMLHDEDYGPKPVTLESLASISKSDLYVILDDNIRFQEDPIRYGGNIRESDTSYWVSLCERYDLNYVVVSDDTYRADAVHREVMKIMPDLRYERRYNT